MESNIDLNSIYKPSEDVVAREVQGEFIIIPITSGIAEFDDEIFSLNETGCAIWNKLNGKKSFKKIVEILTLEFEGSAETIERDCLGLGKELLKRRMMVKA